MSEVKLYLGDCLDVMAGMEPNSVDTVITDCPYGLSFMGKDWDHGIPGKRFWAEMLRVAKPGATLMAFGGTRTHHRLMCAIEDAGWEIRDCVMYLYGSGFPKSHDISKAIDKMRNDDLLHVTRWLNQQFKAWGIPYRQVLEYFGFNEGSGQIGHWTATSKGAQPAIPSWEQWQQLKEFIGFSDEMDAEVWKLNGRKGKPGDAWYEREVVGQHSAPAKSIYGGGELPQEVDITAPATDAAAEWDGWGTALKPSWENIVLATKPFDNQAERDIIVGNLYQMEAQLWSLLPVRIAVGSLGLSEAEHGAVCDSAQWGADERASIQADLCEGMDTSQFASAVTTCLSIVTSWRSILDAGWNLLSTSTTSTETGPTIDLTTLRSCVLALTPRSIIQAEIEAPGSMLSALPAARYLNAASASLSGTLELFALESAIEQGHISRLDGIGLEPNYRHIILAMKPRDGTFANNALEWGVAGLWVDGARIPTNGRVQASASEGVPFGCHYEKGTGRKYQEQSQGRWPANLILSHHAECVQVGMKRVRGTKGHDDIRDTPARSWKNSSTAGIRRVGHADADGMETVEAWDCHPDCPVRILGEQSGESRSNDPGITHVQANGWGHSAERRNSGYAGDTGTAARFFYCAKASRKERNAGLEGMEEKERAGINKMMGNDKGGESMRTGSGNIRNNRLQNHHPTVKPLDLMRYLCKLTKTPSGGIVLDPFMGSGTTGMAAIMEGREFIGIELDADYHEIARRRIEWARGQVRQLELAF